MKNFRVRYSDDFYDDLASIVTHIVSLSGSRTTARKFYENALKTVERRSYGADSYEKFHPYDGSPEYYRIYFGKYIIFYTITDDWMEVKRMFWSGSDIPKRIR